jgi:hypothetical protein
MEIKTAEKIAQELRDCFPADCKVVVGRGNEIVLTTKSANLLKEHLIWIGKLIGPHKANLGRSGPNFRMTIF